MATQIQATPTLFGADARRLLEELNTKPKEQIAKAEKRRAFFLKIKRKGSKYQMNGDLKFNIEAVKLARLGDANLPDLADFDCGDQEMNTFLTEEAYEEQGKGLNSTILLYYDEEFAAFVSVCCDAIPLHPKEN